MNSQYPGADRSQWFGSKFPGAPMRPNVIVLHTTEGSGWPDYQGGGTTPHLTVRPLPGTKRLQVRQHLPLDRSARALRNEAGGVETNTLNCIQIELVGTCDPRQQGKGMMFWPDAPAWAVDGLGDVLATLHELYPAIPLTSGVPGGRMLHWAAYPSSFGTRAKQRMTGNEWRRFKGVCGHQHVPENSHGDPGDLHIGAVIRAALGSQAQRAGLNDVQRARKLIRAALGRATTTTRKARLAAGLRALPPK